MNELQRVYLDLLEHDSESVREEATRNLLDMLDIEVVDVLLENVKTKSHPGLLESIWLLGKSEETRVTEVLMKLFESEEPQIREVVAGAFAEIGDVRPLQQLIDALQDEHASVRDSAAIALGELRDSRAIDPLIALLKDEDSQQVAAWALAMIGDKRALEPLAECLVSASDPAMRGMAARALGRLDYPEVETLLVAALADEDESVLIETIRVLGESGSETVAPDLAALKAKSELPRVQLACSVALARCGQWESEIEFLSEILREDPDWGARLSALMGFREMEYSLAQKAVRDMLRDEHWLVRKAAARTLLMLQDEDLYDMLEDLFGDEDEDIMQAVIESSFYDMLEIVQGDEEDEEEL